MSLNPLVCSVDELLRYFQPTTPLETAMWERLGYMVNNPEPLEDEDQVEYLEAKVSDLEDEVYDLETKIERLEETLKTIAKYIPKDEETA